eukprot:2324552-Pyramimonas_sp.AAC.1
MHWYTGAWVTMGSKARSPSALRLQHHLGAREWLQRMQRILDLTHARRHSGMKLTTRHVNTRASTGAAQHYTDIASEISSEWSVHRKPLPDSDA